uniref:Ribosomal protein L34 n=1 Tax=Nitzschia sp. IriIs04 TaxID=1444690 RepID=A0A0S3QPS3_9STRA|nr:ribosomal protein L34 [Nitzschia sp. IriIs04]BAT70315.1 ribosomal protein L34 [Nitzschia sp. IriIs04]
MIKKNKSIYSQIKVSGFLTRMRTKQGQTVIKNRRKKGRKRLSIKK